MTEHFGDDINSLAKLKFDIIIFRNKLQELKQQLKQSWKENPNYDEEQRQKDLLQQIEETKSRFLNTIKESKYYPTEVLVGLEAAYAAWEFLVAEELKLEDLEQIANAMLSNPSEYFPFDRHKASFRDRLSLLRYQSQIFGNIWNSCNIGELEIFFPYPISEIESVDEMRKMCGLDSLVSMACYAVAENVNGPIMLPAAYALNLVKEPWTEGNRSSETPEVPLLFQPEDEWSGIPEALLLRRARFSQHLATLETFYEERKEPSPSDLKELESLLMQIDHLARENFHFVVDLTFTLGFPTNLKVGRLAAEAAVAMCMEDSDADGQLLQQLFRSAFAAYKDNQLVTKPSSSDLASLGDLAGFKATGYQIFGTCWVSPQQAQGIMIPAPLQDVANIDQRRAEVGLTPWHQHALELQNKNSLEALLPAEYFLTLSD